MDFINVQTHNHSIKTCKSTKFCGTLFVWNPLYKITNNFAQWYDGEKYEHQKYEPKCCFVSRHFTVEHSGSCDAEIMHWMRARIPTIILACKLCCVFCVPNCGHKFHFMAFGLWFSDMEICGFLQSIKIKLTIKRYIHGLFYMNLKKLWVLHWNSWCICFALFYQYACGTHLNEMQIVKVNSRYASYKWNAADTVVVVLFYFLSLPTFEIQNFMID